MTSLYWKPPYLKVVPGEESDLAAVTAVALDVVVSLLLEDGLAVALRLHEIRCKEIHVILLSQINYYDIRQLGQKMSPRLREFARVDLGTQGVGSPNLGAIFVNVFVNVIAQT